MYEVTKRVRWHDEYEWTAIYTDDPTKESTFFALIDEAYADGWQKHWDNLSFGVAGCYTFYRDIDGDRQYMQLSHNIYEGK